MNNSNVNVKRVVLYRSQSCLKSEVSKICDVVICEVKTCEHIPLEVSVK